MGNPKDNVNTRWRLIAHGVNNGFYNMAVDEAVSIACREGIVPPTLRFYTWSPPCVSIGYFQKASSVFSASVPDKEIVRRITGGRAVFHGNDLSYSMVCDTANSEFPNNILGTYHVITAAFITGLEYLGIAPDPINTQPESPREINYRRSQPRTGRHDVEYSRSSICFSTILGHEITVNGQKLIGSAQHRWPDLFLQHGSILMTGSFQENGKNSISLSEILKDKFDADKIIPALCAGFKKMAGIDFVEGCLNQYELDLAENLAEEKYSKASWNFRRL
ncbi:MAG TPA: biotin/lipoate A/B protein ligase family protein [Nitrospirota bacterium]|nr:biotin/lipoate A/B protein ligase family protein [Nitrospirota bacterium]